MPALFRICYNRLAARSFVACENIHRTVIIASFAANTLLMINYN